MNDLSGGRDDRDAGMELALSNERLKWRLGAMLVVINDFPPGWEGLAEEFQPPVIAKFGSPHVPQVWGALTGALIRMGWFEHTGVHDQCAKRTSHACDGKRLRKLQGGAPVPVPETPFQPAPEGGER